ncbi:uncharacterized protein BX663DRAFT_517246 [Cokeromyces recurvatus]|uniref:uncharacterized protein n=1 Tax=Cokeromyces recurvatus TaxID=90255 RepID=UPI00221EB00D|nr:uncharacterized protein BX663DRAFT_517246 [Cokeromyces recurvatus]KAI7900680.1 hypothetical protein BX663DRAFT_517246 [Cokeromyces recurvatus]
MMSLILCIMALSLTIWILCKTGLLSVDVVSFTNSRKYDDVLMPCGSALFVPSIFCFFIDFGLWNLLRNFNIIHRLTCSPKYSDWCLPAVLPFPQVFLS